jgi:hypothetical protein
MTSKPLVYLAGPITGCGYAGASAWRDDFAKLVGDSVACLSPMRGKDYLAAESHIDDAYPSLPLSSQKGVFTRDFNDCTRCDLLVANLLGASRVSIGTTMEIAWCSMRRVPIVLVVEPQGNLHDHAMIREAAGFRVESVEEAAWIAKAVVGIG